MQFCAVVSGAAYCWGYNYSGQLGDNTTDTRNAPVPVKGLVSGVTAINAGLTHTCAITNGRAYCWGNNSRGQLGDGTNTSSLVPVAVKFPE
jgi:alpha-tubulin suppressor-like RCC1 family protein